MKHEAWWRDPLVHFLAIGALLFLVFHWRGGGGPGSDRIVITPGQIESMAAGFARTWQRPPTDQELQGLVDDSVREEIATREATAMGLDKDDTIIRRRLRQKFEFLAEDTIDATPPTDVQLQAWLDENPDNFRMPPEIAFRQVYLNMDRRGGSLVGEERRVLARLSAGGPDLDLTKIGDSLMLPHDVGLSSRLEVARQFGEEFADAILKVEPGRWAGPVTSGYGVHFVWVRERKDGHLPALAEVRPVVLREFLAGRRTRELAAMYERLLDRYRVTANGPGAAK